MEITDGTSLQVGDGLIGQRVGAFGTVSVSGTGSEWLSDDDLLVAEDGYGDLSIDDRGLVVTDDDLLIASGREGRGWINLSGSGTFLEVGDVLDVGALGQGQLHATESSQIVSNSSTIGREPGANGLVVLTSGARWRVQDGITIGGEGNGSLVIEDGGFLENGNAIISANRTAHGQVTVEGIRTTWLNRLDLTVGDGGAGSLEISDDATVQVLDDLTIRAAGRVELDSGRLLVADAITNGGQIVGYGNIKADGMLTNSSTGIMTAQGDSALVIVGPVSNSGVMNAVEGTLDFASEVTNSASGVIGGHDGAFLFRDGLTNNGRLGFTTGPSDVFGDITNSAEGVLSVGGSGTATFYGDFTNSGTLTIEPEAHAVFLGDLTSAPTSVTVLAGLAVDPMPNGEPSEDEPLVSAGELEIAGALQLIPSIVEDDVSEPSALQPEVTLDLFSADSIEGNFEQVFYDGNLLSMDFVLPNGFRSLDSAADQRGLFRTVEYGANSVTITNYLATGGDANGDKAVDFEDFLVLSGNFGEEGDWMSGDFDGDGEVAFEDFLALSQHFGDVQSIQAVPEPATHALWLSIVVAVGAVRRHGRRS